MVRDYTCVDIETTGIQSKYSGIIEIGAVKVRGGIVVDTFSELINPGKRLDEFIVSLTGITDEMLRDKPPVGVVLPRFIDFAGDDVLLGHNLSFDFSFLKQNASNLGLEFEKMGVDTLRIARHFLPDLESRSLDYLCEFFGIYDPNHHRAFNDAKVTAELYEILLEKYANRLTEHYFEGKPLIYKVKKQSPATARQKEYIIALTDYHKIERDYDVGMLTKSEASRIIDKILSEKGRILY